MPSAPVNDPTMLWCAAGILLALFVALGTGADLALAAWQKRHHGERRDR